MMGKSSEVNSGEDLKSSLDRLNVANQDWEPATELVGSLGDQPEVDPMEVPGLCDCEDFLEEAVHDSFVCIVRTATHTHTLTPTLVFKWYKCTTSFLV